MIPRRVELTNVLSFGDRQTVEFTDDEPLWVLCGANGVGKSAVFDAMTFALFGCHRGGAQNADELIRHGANSFLVVFEFDFNDTRYEVHRGRARRAPVQRVRRWALDGWEDIDLSAFRERDRIRAWAVATLGLDYDAFTASVMLRQGEADRIITAQPRDRLAFLRQIIGAERYERLHGRVHTATRNLRARLDAVTAELELIPAVTPEQLAEATTALQQAAGRLAVARADREAAVARIEQARRWNQLECERAAVEQQLRDADARAAEADQIRRDHERFEELTRVLPVAREVVGLSDRLNRLDADIARLTGELTEATAARDQAGRDAGDARQRAADSRQRTENSRREAERLREQITRTRQLVVLADEVAGLGQQLAAFPADLDARHAAAGEQVSRLTEARRTAGERRAAALGLLQAARRRRQGFEGVEAGARCSRCGQQVSEEHARRERADIDEEIDRHCREHDVAQLMEVAATAALAAATADRDRLAGEIRERDRVRDRLDLQRRNLATQGVAVDAAALRAEIEEQERQAAELEAGAAAAAREQREAEASALQRDADQRRHCECARQLDVELRTATTTRAGDASRRDAMLDQLPPTWRDRLPTPTPDDLARDQLDLDRLRGADIAGRFRRLVADAALRCQWEERRQQLTHDLEQVPAEARCPVADAEAHARVAAQCLADAENAHAAARDRDNQLRREDQRRRDLTAQYRELDRDHRLHAELAELLGPQRLQRDLVRTAERDIVRFANATVRNLSRGDLTIELDDAEDGPDRALALRVRRADDPTPIGVQFLSGSQKFRVAVAVALAIGRFAAGQTRPLQSVIIDEGFGSLDRDGLQAMGDELRNLQQSQSLRRLILVSHQEEFTARFPVGYRLEVGEAGTTATPFRREGGAAV